MTRKLGFPAHVADLIFDRDGGCCARCALGLSRTRRGVDWAIHHRRPRGAGGVGKRSSWVNLPANGVCLCNACHAWAEANRGEALAAGWLVSALGIQRPTEIPILHARLGYVRLQDDGGWELAA